MGDAADQWLRGATLCVWAGAMNYRIADTIQLYFHASTYEWRALYYYCILYIGLWNVALWLHFAT